MSTIQLQTLTQQVMSERDIILSANSYINEVTEPFGKIIGSVSDALTAEKPVSEILLDNDISETAMVSLSPGIFTNISELLNKISTKLNDRDNIEDNEINGTEYTLDNNINIVTTEGEKSFDLDSIMDYMADVQTSNLCFKAAVDSLSSVTDNDPSKILGDFVNRLSISIPNANETSSNIIDQFSLPLSAPGLSVRDRLSFLYDLVGVRKIQDANSQEDLQLPSLITDVTGVTPVNAWLASVDLPTINFQNALSGLFNLGKSLLRAIPTDDQVYNWLSNISPNIKKRFVETVDVYSTGDPNGDGSYGNIFTYGIFTRSNIISGAYIGDRDTVTSWFDGLPSGSMFKIPVLCGDVYIVKEDNLPSSMNSEGIYSGSVSGFRVFLKYKPVLWSTLLYKDEFDQDITLEGMFDSFSRVTTLPIPEIVTDDEKNLRNLQVAKMFAFQYIRYFVEGFHQDLFNDTMLTIFPQHDGESSTPFIWQTNPVNPVNADFVQQATEFWGIKSYSSWWPGYGLPLSSQSEGVLPPKSYLGYNNVCSILGCFIIQAILKYLKLSGNAIKPELLPCSNFETPTFMIKTDTMISEEFGKKVKRVAVGAGVIIASLAFLKIKKKLRMNAIKTKSISEALQRDLAAKSLNHTVSPQDLKTAYSSVRKASLMSRLTGSFTSVPSIMASSIGSAQNVQTLLGNISDSPLVENSLAAIGVDTTEIFGLVTDTKTTSQDISGDLSSVLSRIDDLKSKILRDDE